jgi:hypothetical protein
MLIESGAEVECRDRKVSIQSIWYKETIRNETIALDSHDFHEFLHNTVNASMADKRSIVACPILYCT